MSVSEKRFEEIAAEEFSKVPEHFSRRIENLALLIEDEPDEAVRTEEGLQGDDTLLGLYRGVPLSERGSHYGEGGTLPDTITLYRIPLLEEAVFLEEEGRAAGEAAARLAIQETLWHEIGHYFGLSEHAVHAREDARTNHFLDEHRYTHQDLKSPPPRATGAMLFTTPMNQTFTLLFGVLNLLLGLLGLTANALIGEHALFVTNGPLDFVHLAIGAALIYAALYAKEREVRFLKIAGSAYLVLACFGFLFSGPAFFVFVSNTTTDALHLLLGGVMLLAGMSHKNEHQS